MQRHRHEERLVRHEFPPRAMHCYRHRLSNMRAIVILELMHELAGDVAVDRRGTRPAEGWRIGHRFSRHDGRAEVVRKRRAVDRAERWLDEAHRRPAARTECMAVGNGGSATGTGWWQHQIDGELRQAAQPRYDIASPEPQHAAMLSRGPRSVTRLAACQ